VPALGSKPGGIGSSASRRRRRRPARRPRAASLQVHRRPRLCRGRQRRLGRQSRPPTPRRSQSRRPLQLQPRRPLHLHPRRAHRFQRRHQHGRPSCRPCRGRAAAGGQGRCARRASEGRARPSERAAPPRPTQGRRGSLMPQHGWRRVSRPRTRLAAGRRGGEGAERRAGWASEGCAAEGRGAAAAESPSESLDDEVDGVGDGGAPAAQPPGAALELLREASDCGIGQGEAWGEARREKAPPSPHGRWYAHFYVLVYSRRLSPLLSVANPRSRAYVFSAAWSAPLKNRLCNLVSPSNPDGFASDLKTAA